MSEIGVAPRHPMLLRAVAAAVLMGLVILLPACTSDSTTTESSVADVLSTEPSATEPSATEVPATEPPATEPPVTGPVATEPPVAETARVVRAYLHRNELLGPVARAVTGDPVATSRAALEGLLAGPTDDERALGFGSEIPEGTRLLGVRIEDGVSYVDVSSEFESGGGSSSMAMRLAQLVYTATQFESVDSMRLLLDGVAVDSFSGEAVIVDEPITRADIDEPWMVPLILVEGPLPFETVTGDVRVHGTANVFEATVQIRVESGGVVLFENFVTASCGSGCRGTFDVTVPVSVVGEATITVYESSPQDGSEINVVEIPITLA